MIDLLGFALAVLIVELTPGPNMAWLATLTIAEGRRAGLGAVIGISLGLAVNAVLSVMAASMILKTDGPLGRAVSVAAAGMMAWLAWDAWRGSGEIAPTPGGDGSGAARSGRHALAGFALNLLNPKAALFLIAVMPQFVAGGQPSVAQGLAFGATSVAIATAIHLALVFGAEHARRSLVAEGRTRMVRRVLALAMLGVGAWFLAKALA